MKKFFLNTMIIIFALLAIGSTIAYFVGDDTSWVYLLSWLPVLIVSGQRIEMDEKEEKAKQITKLVKKYNPEDTEEAIDRRVSGYINDDYSLEEVEDALLWLKKDTETRDDIIDRMASSKIKHLNKQDLDTEIATVKYKSEILQNMIEKKIVIGYTGDYVRYIKGSPLDISRKETSKKIEEVWKYDKTGKSRYDTKITIINGVVEKIDIA